MEEENFKKQEITEELKDSYLAYAMSVIVARALPDVRDGLKPVQRRILWGMWETNTKSDGKFRKSADAVGYVMGTYHPHGDSSIYQTIVRMVQDFSFRYPLCLGQGNWGSIDGDEAAAHRYTETKLSKISEILLSDIEKDTVTWIDNYANTKKEPTVLPTAVPSLLLNGTAGIAVGMATNIPPHNLTEVVDATIHLAENPKAGVEELVEFIKGPDFPTGGVIYNKKDVLEAYTTGKGPITMRGVTEIKEKKGGKGFEIEITQIPYQVNKSDLIIKIAKLVTDKKIVGIRDIRDQTNKEGISVVIELKSDAAPQKIINQLYKYTDLQKNFNVNMVALAFQNGGLQPQLMSLKDILDAFLVHREEVVRKRAEYELRKAKERAHILEGLVIALSVIDKIIEVIKKSKNRDDAKVNLMKKFKLTEIQSNAILDMRLSALAALERQRVEDELKEKMKLIASLEALLKSAKKILSLIVEELKEIKEKYGDARKTKVVSGGLKDFSDEDLTPKEETIITMSKSGNIKRIAPSSFKIQNRGGKGLIGSDVSDEDFLTELIYTNTHDNILFFTDQGRVFQSKVYEIPQASRTAKGKPIHNFLDIPLEESVNAVITFPSDEKEQKGKFLVMATCDGVIKKTPLSDFNHIRKSGIVALKLKKGDILNWVSLSGGSDEIMMITQQGQSIRFKESNVRAMGRSASGVMGMRLKKTDKVSSMNIVNTSDDKKKNLLVVMSNGYGKQTPLNQYKVQNRGGSGIKTANVTKKTGIVMDARVICEEEELIALSAKGQIIRTDISSVRTAGRATQGVRIMNVAGNDSLIGVICF
ncbi:MAG: DNA gyrase subunit A [Candidatus Harrisonbacteria bacterium CG10_big_fil_rev_8_21_14_0_10_38_8]|uniref:DNA topoisomerase (ATP-hydrolyzing) n=1 Tax=Candidatus Harrisonbacteria bacterium CG10_big_fil_rev_8_21_14_0_10_38_8 TaxID=1974582 RepID=A0A2M6WKR4_9BACT|nr:MAG: DNA gyrase subunit A [Candidatus Harrisonbacteria bacterium CG10_big_fil_rev_8_21_14_0_10_38_8]